MSAAAIRRIGIVLAAIAFVPWLPRLLATRSDPLVAAEALFVFPGDLPARARCAARLYREGLAPVVVFSGGRVAPQLEAIGRPVPDAILNAEVARSFGVPPEAIVTLDAGTSTFEDAGVLADWLRLTGLRSVIAVTSPSHSRRALWTTRLALDPLGANLQLASCGQPYAPEDLWFLEEEPLIRTTNETLKLVLYLGRYLIPTWLGLRPPPGSPEPARRSATLPPA